MQGRDIENIRTQGRDIEGIRTQDMDIMQDSSEIIHYDEPDIPLYIQTRALSRYPGMRALCHWHEDIEWIRILSGRMYYDVNGEMILLEENDCLMVNSRQMHYGYSCRREECGFICILFHPLLLTGCRSLQKSRVQTVTENPAIQYLRFGSHEEDGFAVRGLLDQMVRFRDAAVPAYELEVTGALNILWSFVYRRSIPFSQGNTAATSSDLSLQKTMVSYIYRHYREKVTLDDIAASGNVCRSKCCNIFRHYLQQSPIDFLNTYRLEVSRSLLERTDTGVTEIALACGFNHLSYFSKLFLRHYGCSPRDYRRLHGSCPRAGQNE